MRRFLIALQFLTRFPINLKPVPSAEEIGLSMVYFPLAGLCMGGGLVVLNGLLAYLLPPLLVDTFLVLGLALITGAMHLDGLADTTDGFYAGNKVAPGTARKEKILSVMKDSQIGVMGALAIFFVLLLKMLSLHSLLPEIKTSLLLLTPTLSRWYLLLATVICETANPTENGLGKTFTRCITREQLIKASLIPCILASLTLGVDGLFLILVSLLIAYCLVKYIERRIGGMTGDTFGALNEIMEVTTLVIALALLV